MPYKEFSGEMDQPTSKGYKEFSGNLDTEGEAQMSKIGNIAKGVGTAALDIVGGIPGFLAGVGAGSATALAHQDATGGLDLAKEVMEKTMPSKVLGINTEGNKGYEYAMKPLEWFSQALGFAASGYGEIAKALGVSEAAVKQVNSAAELAMLAGTAGVGGKAKKAVTERNTPPAVGNNPLVNMRDARAAEAAKPPTAPPITNEGAGAFQAINDRLGYQQGEFSPMKERVSPTESMAGELAASGERQRGGEADTQAALRQTAMEQDVARQTGLDMNAAERARQEAAGSGLAEHTLAKDAEAGLARDAGLTEGLNKQREGGVQGELDVGNTNRAYTDMLADDSAGGKRPLTAAEYVKTLDNLNKEGKTGFKMPEDLDASYQHYLDTVSGKQAGLFDIASHTDEFAKANFVESIPRLVQEHPSVKAADAIVAKQTKLVDGLKEKVAKGEANAASLIAETRTLAQDKSTAAKTKVSIEGELISSKQETAGLSEAKDSWSQGPKKSTSFNQRTKGQGGGLLIGEQAPKGEKFADTLDLLSPPKLSPEEFVAKYKDTPDINQNVVQRAANYGMKGGNYMALKTKNPLIAHVVDRFLDANNQAKSAIASQIHDYLAPAGRKLSADAKVDIFTAQQVAERTGKPLTAAELAQHGFSDAQIKWAEAHTEVMGNMMKRMNESLVAAKHSPVDPKIAYVSSRMTGQFRRMVLDSDKNVIGMLSADNRFALDKQVKQYKALGKDHIVGEENYYGGRNTKEGLPKDLDQILDFLSKDDPKTKEFVENIKQMVSDDAYNYMNAKTHAMGKKGIFGTEGNKLLMEEKKNALEGMQAQIDYAEKVIQWSELSKAVADTKELMSPDSGLNMPNARSYLKDYVDNALGNNPTKLGRALQNVTSVLGDITGTGTKQPTAVLNAMRQGVNGVLLGANPLFLATQFIQPFKSMPGTMAWLESKGLKKNFDFGTGYSYLLKAGLDIVKEAKGAITDPIMKGAIDFASDNHVYSSDLFDSNNSVKTTAAGAVSKGLQYGTGQLEQFTRKSTYFAFVKMMNENGITPDNGLYKAAQKLTDIAMNNYSPIESSMGYSALGTAGRTASNLTSYKMNELSRLSLITRDSVSGILKEGDLGKPFLTELMSQVAFGGLKGTILYAEANEIVKLISDKMGTPTSLTKLLLDSKIPSYLTHGMFAAAGGDMSQRLGMTIVPGSLADTLMPGASKIGSAVKAGYEAVTSPSEFNTKNAVREIAPGGLAGPMDRAWFSGKDAQGNEHSMNRAGMYANATRNEADKAWKTFGGTGINESIQKEKEYVNKDIEQRYTDKRTHVLTKMKQDFFTNGKFNRDSIDKYIKYQGDPASLQRDFENIPLEQKVDATKLAIFKAAASNSITNAHKLMRRTGKE